MRLRATRLTAMGSTALRSASEVVFDFTTGILDPRITFSRAGQATYDDGKFGLDILPPASTAAAFSVRLLGSGYSGPLLRVRRSSDNAEMDIGAFAAPNGDRWLDEQALSLFCGAPKYPLSAVTGAAAAFSLRLIRREYTGFAIRVRRSSDNAEINIGFTSQGALDTASLLAFTGAGSGFVVTWYDQSGNGRNAVCTVGSDQPRIVNAGVVETKNSIPSINFNINSNTRMQTLTPLPEVAKYTLSAVATGVSDTGGLIRRLVASSISVITDVSNPNLIKGQYGGYGTVPNPTQTNIIQYVVDLTVAGNNNFLYCNGAQINVASAGTTIIPSESLIIGNIAAGYRPWGGYISEIIITNNFSETDRLSLERSQAAYYGITYATALPSATVTTFYDQSGNARHLMQTTAARQPRIVNGGLIDSSNGRPVIVFLGDQTLQGTSVVAARSALAVLAPAVDITSVQYAAGGANIAAFQTPGSRRIGIADTASTMAEVPDAPLNFGTLRVVFDQADESSIERSFRNGVERSHSVQSGVGSFPGVTSIGSRIDANPANPIFFTGSFSELVLFPGVLSGADRQFVEQSAMNAFGVTP